MIGDFSAVALRRTDDWTGTRLQQGRVLLDGEWNLNLDAADRRAQWQALDTIGLHGVPRGGDDAFWVGVSPKSEPPAVALAPGRMWVEGLAAVNREVLDYKSGQDDVPPLPPTGRILVYLDVFPEHVHPAEDEDLVEPALAQVESSTRVRVGWRVRWAETTEQSAFGAWRALAPALARGSTGRLGIEPIPVPAAADPCAPAGPAGLPPDGLLRVEVLDGGTQETARFAWSFENAAVAAPVVRYGAATIVVSPRAGTDFRAGDRVELSWRTRRADRLAHGDLYRVASVAPVDDGIELTVDPAVPVAPLPDEATGRVARRWDGAFVAGDSDTHELTLGDRAYATVTIDGGRYEAGDWWATRVRQALGGVEKCEPAEADGIEHAYAPLALVDLDARSAQDARRRITSLRELGGTCSLTVHPGDDLQRAVDALPSEVGGRVCLQAGDHELTKPLEIARRQRVEIHGAGPATVVRGIGVEALVRFEDCVDVALRDIRFEPGPVSPTAASMDVVAFLGCSGVSVTGCAITCGDAEAIDARSCLAVRPLELPGQAPDRSERVRIEGSTFEIGARQTGVIVRDVGDVEVTRCRLALAKRQTGGPARYASKGIDVSGAPADSIRLLDNVVAGVALGLSVGSGTELADVVVRNTRAEIVVPPDAGNQRGAVKIVNAVACSVTDTNATVTRIGGAGARARVEGIRVEAKGPFVIVRDSLLRDFDVGVAVVQQVPVPQPYLWVVERTLVTGSTPTGPPVAVDAAPAIKLVTRENLPDPPMQAKVMDDPFEGLPGELGGNTSVAVAVKLTHPAPPGGASVALRNTNPNAATVPASVTIPAGQTRGTFTVKSSALGPNAAAQETSLTAIYPAEIVRPQPARTLKVKSAAAMQKLELSPTRPIGGADVTAIFKLTAQAPPQTEIAVASKPAAMATLPAERPRVDDTGLKGQFTIKTSPTEQDQRVAITASHGGVDVTSELWVLREPLLVVSALRLLHVPLPIAKGGGAAAAARAAGAGSAAAAAAVRAAAAADAVVEPDVLFDSRTPDSAYTQKRRVELTAAQRPNAIEVVFAGADVKKESVTSTTFAVRRQDEAALGVTPHLEWVDSRTVRWVADRPLPYTSATPGSSVDTTYRVTLSGGVPGDRETGIRSTRKRQLDGDHDGAEGGDFTAQVVLRDQQPAVTPTTVPTRPQATVPPWWDTGGSKAVKGQVLAT